MKTEKTFASDRAIELFADMLIEKIKSFSGDWHKPWFTGHGAWPRNLSGRRYNGMNAFMLSLLCEKEGYRLPVFATFDRVTSLNYRKDKQGVRVPLVDEVGNALPKVSINKGSKSFPVFITTFTVVDKETKEKIKYDDYKQMTEEDRAKYNVYPKLSVYNVFNVDQTNLRESRPELYQALEKQFGMVTPEQHEGEYVFEPLDRMIEERSWVCPILPMQGDSAYYRISTDEIVLPLKAQFEGDKMGFYGTAFHEMAHSTGAESRLNRLKPGQTFGSPEYALEELTAEMTAALVCKNYGMEKYLKDDTIPYLKNWLESLKKEPDYVKSVLMDVKKASAMLIEHIDGMKVGQEVKLTLVQESQEDESARVLVSQVASEEEEQSQESRQEPSFHRGR